MTLHYPRPVALFALVKITPVEMKIAAITGDIPILDEPVTPILMVAGTVLKCLYCERRNRMPVHPLDRKINCSACRKPLATVNTEQQLAASFKQLEAYYALTNQKPREDS